MLSTSSSRFIVITLILIVLAAITINANWGSGFGFSMFKANNAAIASENAAEPAAPMIGALAQPPAAAMTTPLNAITSFDASLVTRFVIGAPTPPAHISTNEHRVAADASGNCAVNSTDSAQITLYVLGLTTGTMGTTLTPPGPCGALPITTNVVRGDPSGAAPIITAGSGSASVSLPAMFATPGLIIVPITVSDLTGLGVVSYDMQVTFDPAVITPASPAFSQTGTLSSSMSIGSNTANSGHLIIAASAISALSGSGTLLDLRFNVVGTNGQSTALTFADYTDPLPRAHQGCLFNEGLPDCSLTNGSVTIGDPATATNTPTPTDTPTDTPTATPTPPCLTYDVADDFSATMNPNGPWTFGYTATLGGTLVVYNSLLTGDGIDYWRRSDHPNYPFPPEVGHNPGGPFTQVSIDWAANGFNLHPGPDGTFSLARWTAPTSGMFSVNAVFKMANIGTTDVHVLRNSVSIFDDVIAGRADSGPFSTVVSVSAGDTIDFIVGHAGNYIADSTDLRAIISSCPTISGTFTYGNAVGPGPAPPRFVQNVLVSGAGSPNISVTTGISGTYALTGFGAGSYTVTPTKPGGSNPAINSFDAARISQHAAGITLLTGNQLAAADVSGNNVIQSFDASRIAQYVVALPSPTPPQMNLSGTWRFYTNPVVPFPPLPPSESRTYSSITSNIAGEDYTALLLGDVSGNWNPASHARPVGSRQLAVGRAEGSGPERGVAVELPQIEAAVGKEIIIPVSVDGIADKGIISYEFDLRYDPAVIQPLAEPVDVAGTVSRGLSVVTNSTEPGLLRVVVYGPIPIDENGVLLNLRFTTVGEVGSVSPLTWERILFNEGEPRVMVSEGRVEISY